MDCRSWDEDAYRDAILQEREILYRTIFRAAFDPTRSSNLTPDLVVTASSDGSIASFSIPKCIEMSSGNLRADKSLVPLAEPNWVIQGHDGPAYDIKFYCSREDSLLLSCGDDGRVRGWKWKEISALKVPTHGENVQPVLDLVNPQHKGPWGALSPVPENNAMAVNIQDGSIFTAAGDSCAYCWDVENCQIKTVFRGHTDYLHCITARNSCNQIVTGSEDGTARIWDCRSGKCIQVIRPEKNNTLKRSSSYISCVALDASESWLACGSGRSLSLWNILAGECVSRIATHATTQDVLFEDNQIVAVGAERLLSRFNLTGDVVSQLQCAPQSAFSVSLHPSGVIAVAGFGALVDIISQFGSHLCTFRCRGM